MNDRFFYYAVIVSLAIHAGFVTHFYIKRGHIAPLKKISEMVYTIVKPPPKAPEPVAEKQLPNLMDQLMDPLKHTLDAPGVPQPPKPEFLREPDILAGAEMFERKPERLKGVKVTKEVSVPVLKSDKINTPSYITYYQIVRDRIRDRAYSNYTKLSMGEVFVTFVIKSDGALSGLQVLEAKSAANDFLREVGVKSVKEAAPFPPFPKDLSYPELTFNVSISFQYREE
jgi:periplasmic protein TonB